MSQHSISPFALLPFSPPFKKLRLLGIALTLVLVLFLFCGARLLPRFLIDMSSSDPLNQVYYTTVQFFGASIDIPRPAVETRSELQKLITNGKGDAHFYRLLAEQDERLLDFTNAEKNLLQFVQGSTDKAESYGVLAGFYEKHLRFGDAVNTLLKQVDVSPNEPSQIAIQDRQRYKILHSAIYLIESRKLEKPDSLEQFNKLLQLYPEDSLVYQELLKALITRKQHAESVKLLERYRQKFPRNQEYALNIEVQLLEVQGNIDAALQVYSQSYQPRWSDSLLNSYLGLLKRSGRFGGFVQSLGQKLKQNPTDFPSVTLLFRSTLNQGNLEAARQVLFHYRAEKESHHQAFSNDELETLAHYFYSLNHFNEAARYFSTLALQAKNSAKKEESLFQLYEVMLDAQNRPTQLGGGDLDYFKTVASLDASPGFLNGMLSLILNRSYPGSRYEEEQERAVSYFNRARAAELLEFFQKTYPASSRLPRMEYQNLETLKAYGRWETITQRGAVFLKTYPDALEAPAVGTLMADA